MSKPNQDPAEQRASVDIASSAGEGEPVTMTASPGLRPAIRLYVGAAALLALAGLAVGLLLPFERHHVLVGPSDRRGFRSEADRLGYSRSVAGVEIPDESPEYFQPWRRDEVERLVGSWRRTPPVDVTADTRPEAGDYLKWRKRADALVTSLAAGGQSAQAPAINDFLGKLDNHEAWFETGTGSEPPKPGPEPQELVSGVGEPPTSIYRGPTKMYLCRLPGVAVPVVFHDHSVASNYPFLLNETGVSDGGVNLNERPDTGVVFRLAGVDNQAGRVLRTVSRYEGGFEAVNTYDTGYVSAGFIQFAAMQSGRGSLISVLSRMKAESASDYRHYFHNFGMDVDDLGELTVVDPDTGDVLRGPQAVLKVIDDKRLTAVLYHAGAGSRAFQVAQLEQARDQYFAPDHSFDVPVASVTDYTNPVRPVKNYYYGEDAIAKAKQFADAMDAQPLSPSQPVSPPVPASVQPTNDAPALAPPVGPSHDTGSSQHSERPVMKAPAAMAGKNDARCRVSLQSSSHPPRNVCPVYDSRHAGVASPTTAVPSGPARRPSTPARLAIGPSTLPNGQSSTDSGAGKLPKPARASGKTAPGIYSLPGTPIGPAHSNAQNGLAEPDLTPAPADAPTTNPDTPVPGRWGSVGSHKTNSGGGTGHMAPSAGVSATPSMSAVKPLAGVDLPPNWNIPGEAYHGPRYVFRRERDLRGTYGQVFKSGAGQTAIVDRCVQHGFDAGADGNGLSAKFEQAVAAAANGRKMTVHDLAKAEIELIPVVQNRIDVLHIAYLSKPPGSPRKSTREARALGNSRGHHPEPG